MTSPSNSPFGVNYLDGTLLRDGLQDIIDRESDRVAQTVEKWVADGIDHMYFVGCGGSRAIMEPVKWLLDRYSTLPTDAYTGWEFVTRAPQRLNKKAAVALASHSGTTEEVLLGMDLAHSRGARTIGFSLPETTLAQGSQVSLTYTTKAVNLAKLLMSYMVTANLIKLVGDRDAGERLLKGLHNIPATLHAVKEATEEHGRQLAAKYKDANNYYLVGTGPLAGLAYQFQICTLMEMQWLHASALNAAEFRHGPYEIVQEGQPMIFLLGTDVTRPVAEKALNFAQRYGAETLVFDLANHPEVDPDLAPFAIHCGLQWFAWYLAQERNHPLPTRRYMWKVPY